MLFEKAQRESPDKPKNKNKNPHLLSPNLIRQTMLLPFKPQPWKISYCPATQRGGYVPAAWALWGSLLEMWNHSPPPQT